MAEEILKCVKPSATGCAPLLTLAQKVLSLRIPNAIMITDGTGSNEFGGAMTIHNNKISYISLAGSALNEY